MGYIYSFLLYNFGPLGPLSIVSSVNIYKSTKMKILSIICIRPFFSGRPSCDCSIQQAWLSIVGSTAGGVGFLRTPILSWKVGRGSAGGQSLTCESYSLIISESDY